MFGLVFKYAVGFILALSSYSVEPASAWLYKRSYGQYKHLEWATNATLQLQRLAHESIRQGTWSKGTDTIPITEEDETLALLDISNLQHPVLRAPDKEEGVSSQSQSVNGNTSAANDNDATNDDAASATVIHSDLVVEGEGNHDPPTIPPINVAGDDIIDN
ncbi:putative cytochrome p450 [Rosellinia necatrix]|uniref:Putative cytochrome p450 n=1 Tax=Rosellinia necatrix TaxID=77044 RepID=A0A1W2TPV3_ROSNE|nr:putative cytochrome p450 [Rosellinia necatrix]